MAQSVMNLTQSRFYSPAFNAAVFDGPIRIYFAQHQEAQALSLYFHLQKILHDEHPTFPRNVRSRGGTIFVMLYPNEETFAHSFISESANPIVHEVLGGDHVIGLRGPLMDQQMDSLLFQVKSILRTLPMDLESASPSA